MTAPSHPPDAGPTIDASLHLAIEVLEERVRALASPPLEAGTVAVVVLRLDNQGRLTPSRCALSPEGGLEGDRWSRADKPLIDAQVSIMRVDVAEVIANGQALSLFGDNLLVDLDLSPSNLPTGTRVRVGTALCEVTSKPHKGCVKFSERFGQAGRDVLGAAEFQDLRLRGIYLRVVEAGEVGPGGRVEVVSRGDPRADTSGEA